MTDLSNFPPEVREAIEQFDCVTMHGDKWCALYGSNLQDGVAGFGDTPAKAMWDFDVQWFNAKAAPTPSKQSKEDSSNG